MIKTIEKSKFPTASNDIALPTGAASSFSIANYFIKSKKTIILVCENNLLAKQTCDEINLFAPDSCVFITDSETLPYDQESPHSSIVSDRAKSLNIVNSINESNPKIIATSAQNALRKISTQKHWIEEKLALQVGTNISPEQLKAKLEDLGYEHNPMEISFHGEYSNKNNVIDLFSMGSDFPVRIRINKDNEVEEIVQIKISDQRSTSNLIESIDILPSKEMPVHEGAIDTFRRKYRKVFFRALGDYIYESVVSGNLPDGIEYYLPLFQEDTATIFDYIPAIEDVSIFKLGDVDSIISSSLDYIHTRYNDMIQEVDKKLLPPELVWMTKEEIKEIFLKASSQISIKNGNGLGFHENLVQRRNSVYETITDLSEGFSDYNKIVFCLQSDARKENISAISQASIGQVKTFDSWKDAINDDSKICLIYGPAEKGFVYGDKEFAFITEKELFGQPIFAKIETEMAEGINYQEIQDLKNLKIGDPIVHIKNGVGRYEGLSKIPVGGVEREYLKIGYAESASAMVSMDDLDLVSRYGGMSTDNAPLDKMGSSKWQEKLVKAVDEITKTAKEIIKINQMRKKEVGLAFEKPSFEFARFCRDFPFTETKDQKKAVQEIINDMIDSKPMNRTVVGDVGFGKTEVAMRAAFIAANQGFQVALLVPTSILATQHFESLTKRFQNYDIETKLLTRNTDSLSVKDITSLSKKGKIIIGTHRILQDDVQFSNLGLLVVDEEHRFGVSDKEKIKTLSKKIDTLYMTATPIPRTLSMSLHGVRDMSIISTPPAKRLSIKTLLIDKSESIYKEAIDREMLRDGQVFILHNSIKTIEVRVKEIQKIAPNCRVKFAHGRMKESELEKIMSQFYRHEFDILVCTTVIETGIDVPNANTILIEDAENFGIAQLHQLRGRVGRSTHQAYAYLVKGKQKLSNVSKDRLTSLVKANKLGEGFILATQDLEIRGAGELLGEEQSGHIQTIGFALYMRFLNKVIEVIKKNQSVGDFIQQAIGTKVELNLSALIDSNYIENEQARLSLYKRFASVESVKEISQIEEEMKDRFGTPPENTENIINISKIRAYLKSTGVDKYSIDDKGGIMIFSRNSQIVPHKVEELVEQQPEIYSQDETGTIRFKVNTETRKERLEFVIRMITSVINK